MKTLIALFTLGSLAFAGEKQLFNGKDLEGWQGSVHLPLLESLKADESSE